LQPEHFRVGLAINADAELRESEARRRGISEVPGDAAWNAWGNKHDHTHSTSGIGGWTFEPWRDNFYPKGLAHAKELHYASRQLTAIE
jgi:hypothetical protein